ncbi:MAG: FtsH protease activity modulator HflK [Sphaerochaetaceae bacterium]|nr:FtsH protease activity modulator HflK [Sphaerochaetaceae bacterium]
MEYQNDQNGYNGQNGGQNYYRPHFKKPNFKPIKIRPAFIVWGVIFLIVLIGVFSSMYMVDQTEQAVVLRLGQYLKTVGPGLHARIPFGIDTYKKVATQTVQTLTFGYRATAAGDGIKSTKYSYSDYTSESTMLTGDLNIVDIQWIVQYKVDDPYKWLYNVGNNGQTISDVSRSVVNQLVGDLPILSIMTSERTSIEVEAEQMMQEILDSYDMGIRIVTVKLQDIVPPEGDVQDAFEDVNKAIQDMNKLINEGKENYNKVIPSAQGEASKLIQQAQGYAAERVNTAQGDVARFESVKAEYEKNKDITARRLYLETMEEILSDSTGGTLTIIDRNLENFLPVSDLQAGGAK